MSGLTATVEEQIINDILLAGGSVWLALHTADPGNAPDGSTEVGVASYAREEVLEADWTVAGNGPTTISNDAEIRFDTFEQDVGDITHATFVGSETGDDHLVTGEINPVKNYVTGDFVLLEAGDVTFEVD
jgi:hypothetical protein